MDNVCDEELSKIVRCRYVDLLDIPKIKKLNRKTFSSFSLDLDLRIIYEKACLSLVQENERQELISAIFLCNYPNIPEFIESSWPSWIKKFHDLENSTEANTLFIHFLVWNECYEQIFFRELLTATFYMAASCAYIILVQPLPINPEDAVCKDMTIVIPKNESNKIETQVLYVSEQRQFIPEMKFRLVIEEDNDDVIQILDAECKTLREFYGDFYISEMMRHPVDSRRIIVSEKETSIAAVMCLNNNVDLDLLNDKFDLTAFGNLRKIPEAIELSVADSEEEYEFETESDSPRSNTEESNIEQELGEKNFFKNSSTFMKNSRDEVPVPDAFAMELLGHRNSIDELKSWDLLGAGFDCFPKLDYCLVLVPSEQPYFPALDNFVRIPLKPDKDFALTLYVTHRAALQGILRAQEARFSDYENVARLLIGVSEAQNILFDFNEALKRSSESQCRSYIFTCDEVVIGLAIVCIEEEVDQLRRYYHLEDLVSKFNTKERAGRLLRLSLMPIFNVRLGFFLGEIMRLAGFVHLYHRAKVGFHDINDDRHNFDISPCLNVMRSVQPRIRNWPQFKYFYQKDIYNSPFEELFSLFVMTPRMTINLKEIINIKIVVIGASNCGLAFIDGLTLGYEYKDFKFADITLVSINGLPYENSNDFYVKIFTPFKGYYCNTLRNLTPGRANYNVIKGTVVDIDRENQRVHIENCGSLMYDYLIITCGLIFQTPELTNNSLSEEQKLNLEAPLNCFLINDDLDAKNCLQEIRKITEDFTVKKSIVFHGCNIECYSALGTFLELGLKGSWITLIEPKILIENDIFYSDYEIKDMMREVILINGVTVISNCDLFDWTIDRKMAIVKTLLVENEVVGRMVITCDALISFHKKEVCMKTFLAISRAGLVFDGRLVIDAEFRTKDRRVFAAGTMTKYSRKLRANDWENAYYNSVEVGFKLAKKFFNIIMNNNEEIQRLNEISMKFKSKQPDYSFNMPIVISCLLPGGYRYLHVRKPGIQIYRECDDQTEASAGNDVFTSGSCTADIGYFRLRLNQFRTVECITCFSKMDFDIQNIISLYGKHEAMLNDLKTRFLNSEITDFYTYFSESWATALFCDDFDNFLVQCKYSCINKKSNTFDCKYNLREELLSILKKFNYKEISTENRDKIVSEWLEKACYLQYIEKHLIEFLEHHKDELSMYKTTGKEREILREIKNITNNDSDNGSKEQMCICQLLE